MFTFAKISVMNEQAYRAALKRIDELLPLMGDDVPRNDPNVLELDMLSDMVEEYEEVHYPISKPSVADVIRLRMYEMGLNQQGVAALLGVSPSRISELLHGKAEPTLAVARNMVKKLNIAPEVALGL